MALIIDVDKFDLVEWVKNLKRRKKISLPIEIFTRNLLGPKCINQMEKSKPSLSLTGFPKNPLNKWCHSINGLGKQGLKAATENSEYGQHDKILHSCVDEDRKEKQNNKKGDPR